MDVEVHSVGTESSFSRQLKRSGEKMRQPRGNSASGPKKRSSGSNGFRHLARLWQNFRTCPTEKST